MPRPRIDGPDELLDVSDSAARLQALRVHRPEARLERLEQLGQHERVEPEVALQRRAGRHLIDGHSRRGRDGHTNGARSWEALSPACPLARHHTREDRAHLVALDLARRRARQRAPRTGGRRTGAARRQLVDRRAEASACALVAFETIAVAGFGDGQARQALAAANLDTDDGQLRDVGHGAETPLDVVGVDVLARRRDDDVLETSDDLQAPLPIDAAEVPRVEPPFGVDGVARRVVVGVADHHVGSARDDLADTLLVRIRDLQLDARHRLAHAGLESLARTR